MKIVSFEEVPLSDWDNFVNTSNDAWLFHLQDWIKIEEKEGYRNCSFMVQSKNGNPLAIFPLYLYRKRYVGGILPEKVAHTGHGRSGPALNPDLGENERKVVLNLMFSHVDRVAEDNKAVELNVRLPSLAPSYPLSERFPMSPLISYGLTDDVMVEKVIDLNRTEDEIWDDMEARCRYDIRKYNKHDITIRQAESMREVKDYHELHAETFKRTGAKVRPLRYFEDIWSAFHDKGCVTFFFAEKNDEKIGSVIILSYKSRATYWAGATKTKYQGIPASTALLWHAVRWAKANKIEWFEVGPFFPNYPRDSKMYKIGKFKEQFGGQTRRMHEGTKIYNRKRYHLTKLAESIVDDFVGRVRRQGNTLSQKAGE